VEGELPVVVLAGCLKMRRDWWRVAIATATAIDAACDAWRLEQHGSLQRKADEMQCCAVPMQPRHRVSCAARQRKAHRKALGWPLLNVEASQVPVQLCASNRHRPARPSEASATTASAASSSSAGHVKSVCASQLATLNELQISIVARRDRGAVESEILWPQLKPRPARVGRR
jgi:hypothetical protein